MMGDRQDSGSRANLSAAISVILICVTTGAVGYNIMLGQSPDDEFASRRIVNVQADRLEPLLRQLASEDLAPSGRSTHVRVSDAISPAQPNEDPSAVQGDARTGEMNLTKQVQEGLVALGFHPGPASGTLDDVTIAAIKAYQQQRGIAADGQVTAALRDSIEFERKIAGAAAFDPAAAPVLGYEDIRQVQLALTRFGFDPGPVDGNLGERTTSAIRQYQRQIGADPTGLVTPELQASLGLEGSGDRTAQARD